MITEADILKGKVCPPDLKENLKKLLKKINRLEELFALEFPKHGQWIVTSGFRDIRDQMRIYKAKGITDPKKIPMRSKHFSCQAVDIYDPSDIIENWLKANDKIMKDVDVYCEDKTSNWIHIQNVPPGSMKRWFLA